MIYLKEFATAQDYEAVKNNLPTPNVSLITDGGDVKYLQGTEPGPTPPTETRLVCVYEGEATDITSEYESPSDYFSAMEVDGVEIAEVPSDSYYNFGSEGEHIVKYTLIYPTSIGALVFKEVYLSSITIPNSVTSIGQQAFESCFIRSIDIPNSVTSIGDEAFDGCSLTSITIPNGVTSISDGTFKQCGSLTNVTLGNGVTSIGSETFALCDILTSITINTTTPPTLGQYALGYDYDPKNFTIYVPSESVNAYKTASGWSDYAAKIEPIQ